MGFDCTLHVVDESDIRSTFVDLLLSDKPLNTPAIDRGISDDDWEVVKKSLTEAPPEEAASNVCQAALIFASKKHPYHYERGFAISLWPELPLWLAADFPEPLTGSPEALFERLIEKHPFLKGQFPTSFSGNWSTGKFIPAQNIKKALHWVEKQIKEYKEPDKDSFQGLIHVLRYCAEHKLAYWEGTDLPIPMATISVKGNEQRRAERCFSWPDYGYVPIARKENLFVCKYYLGPDKESRTALTDFSNWPPTVKWINEYAAEAAIAGSGKLALMSSSPNEYLYRINVRDTVAAESISRSFKPDPATCFEWVNFWNDDVIALLSFKKDRTRERYPMVQQGDHLEENHSFRPTRDNHDDHWGGEQIRIALARTGSGTSVLLWDDGGFEYVDGAFRKTFSLVPGPMWRWQRETVAAGPDGFFYLAKGLYEAQRGSESLRHLPQLTNILAVRPGPEGSLVLREGDNDLGDWGKLYWPQKKQWLRLKPSLLPDIPRKRLDSIFWLEESGRLLFFTDKEVWFVPWEQLQSLRRSKIG